MPFQQKENSGSLFKNERKQQPNHPDFTGSINVEGVIWRLSGWKKTSKAGKGYLSLSIRPDERAGAQGNDELDNW